MGAAEDKRFHVMHCFSFACGQNWHDPVKCFWLRKWIRKCDDDSETSNWIAANTKVRMHLQKLDAAAPSRDVLLQSPSQITVVKLILKYYYIIPLLFLLVRSLKDKCKA